jgi:thiol-disulfide isomerase/thioredoxin
MKNLLLLIIFVSLLSTNVAYTQKGNQPTFSLTDSAHIRLIAQNVLDSIHVTVKYCSLFPFRGCIFSRQKITQPGTYHFKYGANLPGLAIISWKSNRTVYLVPGDTVEVILNQTVDEKKGKIVHIEASDPYNQYFMEKADRLGFDDIRAFRDQNLKKYLKNIINLDEYKAVIAIYDSISAKAREFVESKSNMLPEWFIETELQELFYGQLILLRSYYNRLGESDKQKIFFPYPDLYNPKAINSITYYEFLTDYLYSQNPIPGVNAQTDDYLALFHSMLKIAQRQLKGEILDKLLTEKISDLYFHHNNMLDAQKVDNFISKEYPDLSSKQKNYIQAVRKVFVKTTIEKGTPAPSFYLRDNMGKFRYLESFKGKKVLLHFWATWCAPCIKEMKELNKLYESLDKNSFEIIHICLDDKHDRWLQILEKEQPKGINLICKGNWEKKLTNAFFIEELPHYTIIDKEGRIIKNKSQNAKVLLAEATD